jgi:hypothetical protein
VRRLLVLVLLLATACGGSSSPRSTPDVAQTAGPLAPLLLQSADLPDLPQRRAFAAPDSTTQPTPQLALCRPATATASHGLANVLFTSPQPGVARVFEVVSSYADDVTARRVFDAAAAAIRQCRTFTAQGTAFTVADARTVPLLPSAQVVQYRLTTRDVISGEVRTVARQGRFVLLLTGYGRPTGGQPLLDFQATVMRKALDRLR